MLSERSKAGAPREKPAQDREAAKFFPFVRLDLDDFFFLLYITPTSISCNLTSCHWTGTRWMPPGLDVGGTKNLFLLHYCTRGNGDGGWGIFPWKIKSALNQLAVVLNVLQWPFTFLPTLSASCFWVIFHKFSTAFPLCFTLHQPVKRLGAATCEFQRTQSPSLTASSNIRRSKNCLT